MEREHQAAGDELRGIRALTDGYEKNERMQLISENPAMRRAFPTAELSPRPHYLAP